MKIKESEWIVEGLIKKNTINVMNVFHDDWCKSNTKKGRNADLCNCNPDIRMDELKQEKQ
jgi:hypothetical protein